MLGSSVHAELERALNLIQPASEDESGKPTSPTEAILSMECLLTTMLVDESDWCTAWTRFFKHVMEKSALPASLRDLELDVPKRLHYMLDSPDGNKTDIKREEEASAGAEVETGSKGRKRSADDEDEEPGHTGRNESLG